MWSWDNSPSFCTEESQPKRREDYSPSWQEEPLEDAVDEMAIQLWEDFANIEDQALGEHWWSWSALWWERVWVFDFSHGTREMARHESLQCHHGGTFAFTANWPLSISIGMKEVVERALKRPEHITKRCKAPWPTGRYAAFVLPPYHWLLTISVKHF